MTSPLVPIVFIHRGEFRKLERVLDCAQKFNPNTPCYFLSDDAEALKSPPTRKNFQLLPIGELDDAAAEFRNTYVHISDLAHQFESFCFERWFLLAELMRRSSLERIFVADSDVLICSDLSAVGSYFANADMTLSLGHTGYCAHSTFINRRVALERVCEYFLRSFKLGGVILGQFVLLDQAFRENGLLPQLSMLSDMRLLTNYHLFPDVAFEDTAQIRNDSTFDHNIGTAQYGFRMKDGIKDIRIKDGAAWCFNERVKREVRMNSLHFSGSHKQFLEPFAQKLIS